MVPCRTVARPMLLATCPSPPESPLNGRRYGCPPKPSPLSDSAPADLYIICIYVFLLLFGDNEKPYIPLIHTHIHTHVHTHMHSRTHTHKHTHTHTHTRAGTHTQTHTGNQRTSALLHRICQPKNANQPPIYRRRHARQPLHRSHLLTLHPRHIHPPFHQPRQLAHKHVRSQPPLSPPPGQHSSHPASGHCLHREMWGWTWRRVSVALKDAGGMRNHSRCYWVVAS